MKIYPVKSTEISKILLFFQRKPYRNPWHGVEVHHPHHGYGDLLAGAKGGPRVLIHLHLEPVLYLPCTQKGFNTFIIFFLKSSFLPSPALTRRRRVCPEGGGGWRGRTWGRPPRLPVRTRCRRRRRGGRSEPWHLRNVPIVEGGKLFSFLASVSGFAALEIQALVTLK